MRRAIIFIILALAVSSLEAQNRKAVGGPEPYFGLEPPGEKPVIFAPGIVSTPMYNHCSIAVSLDGKTIYWVSARVIDDLRREIK